MCKILIVDDSQVIRRLLRAAIERQPTWIVCGEAENGKIGVELVEELRPQLVILDLSMPVMNGLDAAREISAVAPGTPMIMFTMHESESLVREAHRVGIKHVFAKEKGLGESVLNAIRAMLPAA
jgi:DNA-binding NarL/FixJ family response regulator